MKIPSRWYALSLQGLLVPLLLALAAMLAPPARAGLVAYAKYPVLGASNNLMVANTDGTNARAIPNTAGGASPSLSPDGTQVAFVKPNNPWYYTGPVYVIKVDGTGLHLVYNGTANGPKWSPGGDKIAFDVGGTSANTDIYVVSPNGSNLRAAVAWPGRQTDPAWGPDNTTLVFFTHVDAVGQGHAGIWSITDTGLFEQEVVPGWFDGPWPPCGGDYGQIAVSPSWDVAYQGDSGNALCKTTINGGLGSPIYTATGNGVGNPSYSPDGTHLAFDNSSGNLSSCVSVIPSGWVPTGACYGQMSYQAFDLRAALQQKISQYAPVLRYNADEPYFADSAKEATDWAEGPQYGANGTRYGSALKNSMEGVIAAAAVPTSKSRPCQHLTLGLLGPTYLTPAGAACGTKDFYVATRTSGNYDPGDHLDIPGDSSDNAYSGNYNYLTATHPEWSNQYYGALVQGSSGRFYLQYWFFYYYNSMEEVGIGTHEGDWEMVQIGLDGNGNPTDVAFNEHDGHTYCPWSNTEHTGNTLTVYVARDSHASYPYAGDTQRSGGLLPTDRHNGDGRVVSGVVPTDISSAPSWTRWPGKWGASGASPTGPAVKPEWADPDSLAQPTGGDVCTDPSASSARAKRPKPGHRHSKLRAPGLAGPKLGARLQDRQLEIQYVVRSWPRYRHVRRLTLRLAAYRQGSDVPVVITRRVRHARGRITMTAPYGTGTVRVRGELQNRRAEPVSRLSSVRAR